MMERIRDNKAVTAIVICLVLMVIFIPIIASTMNQEEKTYDIDTMLGDESAYEQKEGAVLDFFKVNIKYFKKNIITADGYGMFKIKYSVTNISEDPKIYNFFTNGSPDVEGAMIYSVQTEEDYKAKKGKTPTLPKTTCKIDPNIDALGTAIIIQPGETRDFEYCAWVSEKIIDFSYNYYVLVDEEKRDFESLLTITL